MTYKIPANLGVNRNSIMGQFPKISYDEFNNKYPTNFENIPVKNIRVIVSYNDVKLIDPRGFAISISNMVLHDIISSCTIIDSIIQDECIYACGSTSFVRAIIKVDSTEYQDALLISSNISIDVKTIPLHSKIIFSDGTNGYLLIANGKSIKDITNNVRYKPCVVYTLQNSAYIRTSNKSIVAFDVNDKCRYLSKIDLSTYVDCDTKTQMKITYGNITLLHDKNNVVVEMSKKMYFSGFRLNGEIFLVDTKENILYTITPHKEAIIDLRLNKKHNNCTITKKGIYTTSSIYRMIPQHYNVYIEIANIEIT